MERSFLGLSVRSWLAIGILYFAFLVVGGYALELQGRAGLWLTRAGLVLGLAGILIGAVPARVPEKSSK